MIVAYAQDPDRQGLNSAMNGEVVSPLDSTFRAFREKAISLNFAGLPTPLGDVQVRYGKGLIRIEFPNSNGEVGVVSPVVVVVDAAEVVRNREGAIRIAIDSAAAIDRPLDSQSLDAALALGERLHGSKRRKSQVAAVAVILIAVAVLVIALRRALS